MSLVHPRSLERWQEWRRSHRRMTGIHRARPAARTPGLPVADGFVLHSRRGEGSASTVLGIDAIDDAVHGGLPAVLPYLQGSAHVVTPAGVSLEALDGPGWTRRSLPAVADALTGLEVTSVLTLGWEREIGKALHEWAHEHDVPGAVVQHDLLTPFAPPLPPETTLLAWSAQDGRYHRAGRDDVEVRVVGSQRLWQARHDSAGAVPEADERAVFLGQLGRIDLPRRVTLGAAYSYCRDSGALYRPGLDETDRFSRAGHALLRRRGVELQDPWLPVGEQSRPVVAVFSAELLEAAVRGLPAWVHARRPPEWLVEHWERYGMRPVGEDPTAAPEVGADEPARLIAQILEGGA